MRQTSADTIDVGSTYGGGLSIERARHGHGVWQHAARCWAFGGYGQESKSLRACRHWLALRLGLDSITTLPCRCGDRYLVEMLAGFLPREPELYRLRCEACGTTEELYHDGRALADIADADEFIECALDQEYQLWGRIREMYPFPFGEEDDLG